MASSTLFMCFFMICLFLKLTPTDSSAACPNQNITGYARCEDLPTLNATLYYTYNKPKSSLSVVFIATPPNPDGWVAWGINLNPTDMSMKGAEVIAAFKKNNVMFIQTYYLKSSLNVIPQKLSFDVSNLKAKQNDDGSISIYATLKVPDRDTLNHTWQIGASVVDGMIIQHDLSDSNKNSKGNITLADAGFCDSSISTSRKIVHGIINLVAFGVLFPIGIVIPRYLDIFPPRSDTLTWFHVYAFLQVSGFIIGLAGWAIGITIVRELEGFLLTGHGIIGTIVVCLAAIQIIILFKTTDKGFRYQNIYHYTCGYASIFFGIINISLGMKMMNYDESWTMLLYRLWISILCLIVLLEPLIRYIGLGLVGQLFRFLGF